jgi:predicted dehydrogenase
MSNNINDFDTSYTILSSIHSLDFKNKTILIIGAGWMARQYAIALKEMNVSDVTIFSRNKEKSISLCNEFGFKPLFGDPQEILSQISEKDLTIVSTSISSLIKMTKYAISSGQKNILVEKPGSLYYKELLELEKISNNSRIRIAYNRLTYTNLQKLKSLVLQEGGITSCNFNFTERIQFIDFKKENSDVYSRWGISNSLHIISMVFDLIGFPQESLFYQSGQLEWHPTGSIFVGSGLTEKNIPFSYHADWGSSGRWGIEIMTRENAYRLISLEELFVCHKNSFEWERVNFDVSYIDAKQGVCEEIAIMLYPKLEVNVPLVTLEKASKFNQVAEKILGYDSN